MERDFSKPSDVEEALNSIRQRLTGGRFFRGLRPLSGDEAYDFKGIIDAFGQVINGREKAELENASDARKREIERNIRGSLGLNSSGMSIGRSETAIESEKAELLIKKAEQIRAILFERGQDFTTNPDFQELLYENLMDAESAANKFWMEDARLTASADKTEGKGDQDFVALKVKEEKIDIRINFDFSNLFILNIDFKEGDRYSEEYNPNARPINEMSHEEYKIIDHYFDQFMRQATRDA